MAPSFGRDWTAGSSKAVDWGFASGASVREVVKNHVVPLIYIYVYIYICIFLCICICIYIYVYIHILAY